MDRYYISDTIARGNVEKDLHVPFQQIMSKKEQRGPERDHVTKPPSLQSKGRSPLRSCYHGGPDARTLDRSSVL